VLRPPLDLCKPTGVVLGASSRVLVVADGGGVGRALSGKLAARGVRPIVVAPDGAQAALAAESVVGIYWLPALDDEGDPTTLAPEAWRAALRDRVKLLARAARAFHPRLDRGTFLVAATRLGGRHGVGDDGATAPLGGAVTGLVKALKRERPEALIKAVDFGAAAADAVAERLLAETLADPGAVEIGYSDDLRVTVALAPAPTAVDGVPAPLGPDSVYVITGAAGSIVSAIVADLAASGGIFYLLDLASEPDPSDPDLARFTTDKGGLKLDLARRQKERGERATPVAVEKELGQIERAVAAAAARAAIARAGGTSHYRRVDLRDGAAVAAIVDEIRARHGRIDVLVHAAGLEISHFLPDKRDDEFDLVFDVKADGWYHLLHAIGTMPLGATVAFGSIAGRFGNAGQTDYAAANDLLCKLASHARCARPATRSLVIDWTAWADIGMATRGSIPKMMAAAGIDMLPAVAAIPVVGRELRAGTRGEIVVAGALGVLDDEWDDTGGLDCARITAHGPMIGRVAGWPVGRGLIVETALDPAAEPFLHDHQIDGKAVLPGVMGIEAFAEVATLVGGWRLAAVEDVSFHAPFKFYRGEARTLTIEAQMEVRGTEVVAACRLSGVRALAAKEAQTTIHFTARVRLGRQAPAPVADKLPAQSRPGVGHDAVYRIYFHGPAYQVLANAARNGSAILGRMAGGLPPDHGHGAVVTPARLVELCFQTAGVWEIGSTGHLGLPEHLDRLVVLEVPPEDTPVYAVVTPRANGTFDARIMNEGGKVFVILEGYRTSPLGEVDAALRAPLAAAVA
jgi:NAD(P)-dependent dehydrogenase (short-subunit alcohol dehydrogenase family)